MKIPPQHLPTPTWRWPSPSAPTKPAMICDSDAGYVDFDFHRFGIDLLDKRIVIQNDSWRNRNVKDIETLSASVGPATWKARSEHRM